MASLPANASSPSLALEDSSTVVEVSLMKADGIVESFDPSDEDIVKAVEEKFARRLIWLRGDMGTGRVLDQVLNMALEICVMKYRAGYIENEVYKKNDLRGVDVPDLALTSLTFQATTKELPHSSLSAFLIGDVPTIHHNPVHSHLVGRGESPSVQRTSSISLHIGISRRAMRGDI